MRISGLSLVLADAVLKRTLLVAGASICCFIGTTQTTQQDYREMRGMLSQYTWGASTRNADRNIITQVATHVEVSRLQLGMTCSFSQKRLCHSERSEEARLFNIDR